jgi:hypothetical protein
MLNVAHFTFPRIPPDRGTFLHELRQIPLTQSVQASSCFYPVLEYERADRRILLPGQPWVADWVVIRRSGSWPFRADEQRALLERIPREPYVTAYASDDFLVLRRSEPPSTPQEPSTGAP